MGLAARKRDFAVDDDDDIRIQVVAEVEALADCGGCCCCCSSNCSKESTCLAGGGAAAGEDLLWRLRELCLFPIIDERRDDDMVK